MASKIGQQLKNLANFATFGQVKSFGGGGLEGGLRSGATAATLGLADVTKKPKGQGILMGAMRGGRGGGRGQDAILRAMMERDALTRRSFLGGLLGQEEISRLSLMGR